jgi:hypothetical protein
MIAWSTPRSPQSLVHVCRRGVWISSVLREASFIFSHGRDSRRPVTLVNATDRGSLFVAFDVDGVGENEMQCNETKRK